VTCTSDCERLQRENSILERRLDNEHQRVVECERREQEAVQRIRDTLQLVDEAQLDKEEVGSSSSVVQEFDWLGSWLAHPLLATNDSVVWKRYAL